MKEVKLETTKREKEKVKMETEFRGSSRSGSGRLKFFFFPMVLAFLIFCSTVGVHACPTDCSCKWKGGKQSVECLNRSLRTFPGPIDTGTQVLDLGGNSFETLPSDHFMRLSLINLQKVYLARCRLNHINSRAFRGLSNLVDLDLSNNALREVPTSAFADCEGLMRLVISGNSITHVLSKAFVGLKSLTTLEMSHCGTEVIEKGGFEGLDRLEWLKLEGNKLRRLDGLQLLPLTLKGIWLEDNPWECDCKILELRTWLVEAKVGSSAEPRCRTPPRLVNSTLKELRLDAFACPPEISPTTMYQKIGEGRNVSLLCKVTSTPESTLEWWFNSQPISNTSINILVETTTSRGDPSAPAILKKSELLVLNATADENGTFLCLARNPAGTVMANFTLRVLSAVDPESYAENVTSFVGSYPNLFLIVLSAVAVVGLVIILLGVSLLLCKCSRALGSRARGGRQVMVNGRTKSDSSSLGDQKDGNKGGSGGSGSQKMERHLSETSTITTQTKSNGSVFLLSTSSELGDSNPDLIEGVKRVEADGHETQNLACPHQGQHKGQTYLFNGTQGQAQGQPHPHTIIESFPLDYGLPNGLNVKTLVPNSSGYSLNDGTSQTLPTTYDLAKYPKEYISPSPFPPNTYIYAYAGPQPDAFQQPLYTYVHGPAYAVYGGPEYVTYAPAPSSSCTCILEETEPMTGVEKKPKVNNPVKAKSRFQRQLTTTINESPDEGYEDEGAEV